MVLSAIVEAETRHDNPDNAQTTHQRANVTARMMLESIGNIPPHMMQLPGVQHPIIASSQL